MGTHMKTTVELTDALLREAKRVAHERGTTLRALIEDGLRRVLDDLPRKPFRLRDGSVDAGTPAPGVRPEDGRQLRALSYGARLGYPDDASPREIDRLLAEEDARASRGRGR